MAVALQPHEVDEIFVQQQSKNSKFPRSPSSTTNFYVHKLHHKVGVIVVTKETGHESMVLDDEIIETTDLLLVDGVISQKPKKQFHDNVK